MHKESIFLNRKATLRRIWIIIVLTAVIFLTPGILVAGQNNPDADSIFKFADHLFEQKDYNTAIVEFKRFVFLYPGDDRKPEARFKTGMSYFRQNRFSRAVGVFDSVTKQHGHTDWAIESVFMAAESLKHIKQYDDALFRLTGIARTSPDPETRARALYKTGWLFLEKKNHASAGRAFDAIHDAHKELYGVDELVSRLDEIEDLPVKKPALAGIFSIIPGGGYLYTGRNRDAFVSFIFTGGFAGAAYESFDNDLYITGSILSVIAAGFYSGSVYGSISAAHKYNNRRYENFVDRLKKNTPHIAGSPPGPGAPGQSHTATALAVSFSF